MARAACMPAINTSSSLTFWLQQLPPTTEEGALSAAAGRAMTRWFETTSKKESKECGHMHTNGELREEMGRTYPRVCGVERGNCHKQPRQGGCGKEQGKPFSKGVPAKHCSLLQRQDEVTLHPLPPQPYRFTTNSPKLGQHATAARTQDVYMCVSVCI